MIVVTPATILDFAALAGDASRLHWTIAKEMWHAGESFAFRRGGAEPLLALAGFYPLDPEKTHAEAWFMATPASSAALLPLTRAFRLTISRAPYRSITAICRSPEGKRLARCLGFRPIATTELGEAWCYGADFQPLRRRQ